MLNSRTQKALKPQTLSAATAVFNDASTSVTAVPLDVVGIPVLALSVGAVGVSTTSLTVSIMSTSAIGVTPTAMTIGGANQVSIVPVEGALRRIRTDEPVPEGHKVIVGITSIGGTTVAAANVIGETPDAGKSDGR